MVNVSKEAVKWFLGLKKENDNYLVLSLKSSGCNGFKYDLHWEDKLNEKVEYVVEDKDGLLIAYPDIFKGNFEGTSIELNKEGLNTKVEFKNPNVKNECGCGESIGF